MFSVAILIGIYSYLIFMLGILGQLKTPQILLVTLLFAVAAFVYLYKENKKMKIPRTKLDNPSKLFLGLIVLLSAINMIGALGPELGFDALWYHLTIPKIFLMSHKIFHISGGLFYYSDMPKLTEMLYVLPLSFGTEILAKLIHYSFGILSLIALFSFSRKFFEKKFAFLGVLIFATNLVFAWESTTAYVDLAWTFFEIMALWGFFNWRDTKDRNWLIESAVMLGLAICVKSFALNSLIIYVVLILFTLRKDIGLTAKAIAIYLAVAILMPLPWFIFSFMHTGNPLYPIFSQFYPVSKSLLSDPVGAITGLLNLFIHASDPISPIYLILLPILLLVFKKLGKNMKLITLYSGLALLIWFVIPQTGGSRFILPFLPAFSILSVGVILAVKVVKIQRYLVALAVFLAFVTIVYRGIANFRYVPEIVGLQSKSDFLSKRLNFNYGDFYDTDNFFSTHLTSNDRVLTYGFHNLYYANFPFIDSSYVQKGDRFNYIATQNASLPARFSFMKLVYENPKTNVKLYSLGGMSWFY